MVFLWPSIVKYCNNRASLGARFHGGEMSRIDQIDQAIMNYLDTHFDKDNEKARIRWLEEKMGDCDPHTKEYKFFLSEKYFYQKEYEKTKVIGIDMKRFISIEAKKEKADQDERKYTRYDRGV